MTADYSVAVRSLCEFTARTGDLAFRFTPAPSAKQGVAGHNTVAARRGPDYQRELALEGHYGSLTVRGRADGYDQKRNVLEEFKTHRGDVGLIPANQRALHWAQLKIYGALLCAERSLDAVELALVYFDIGSEQETILRERSAAAELLTHFETQCERFLTWALREVSHRVMRDRCLNALTFPLDGLRDGQRQMAEAVYKAARRGEALMIQAPTGIGKTLGTLFPLLKAAPGRKLDKVFFLAAKTSGRALALAALRQLGFPNEHESVRILELVAKDQACVYPGRPCEAASCPLAEGFYDRLPQARLAAVSCSVLDRATVQAIAVEWAVCPYYLTVELTRWCDIIVGDYHYYFDTSALLHHLTVQNNWKVALLVDEAHNLLTRARDMYSATLEPHTLDAAVRCAPAGVRRPLQQLQRTWRALHHDRPEAYFAPPTIPEALVAALQRVVAAVGDDAVERAMPLDERVLRWHFNALHFLKMADAFGTHSLFDVTRSESGTQLCIRNVNPAPFLAPRFAQSAAAVLFSATLSPELYYRRLLGVPAHASWVDIESPFGEHQLEVRVERISTRFHDRPHSLVPIAELMARQYHAQPGNYLAFFSSFAYLDAAWTVFHERHPQIATWRQTGDMKAADRDLFLAHFTPDNGGIGFAVLGGVFAEGIDLPGACLIGAFIATLGLPRICEVNTEIERRLQVLFNAGYEYAYLFPGMQKVVQAAGRVIRTPTDRGTVHLLDDRYLDARVRKLLPRWWRIQCG